MLTNFPCKLSLLLAALCIVMYFAIPEIFPNGTTAILPDIRGWLDDAIRFASDVLVLARPILHFLAAAFAVTGVVCFLKRNRIL